MAPTQPESGVGGAKHADAKRTAINNALRYSLNAIKTPGIWSHNGSPKSRVVTPQPSLDGGSPLQPISRPPPNTQLSSSPKPVPTSSASTATAMSSQSLDGRPMPTVLIHATRATMAPLSPDRMEKPFATQGDTNGSGGPGQAESSANRRKDPYLTRHIPSKGEEDTNTPKTTPAPLTKPPTYGAKVNEEKSAVAASGPSRVNTLSGGSKQANTNGVRSRDAVPLPPARKSLSSGSAASATPPVKASTTTKPTAASNTMTKGTPKGLSSKAVVGRVTVSAATLERGEAEKSPSLSDLDEEATPLTMVDGRPYTHFIDGSKTYMATWGLKFPRGYTRSSSSSTPWRCPLVGCGLSYGSLKAAGTHFNTKHRFLLLNDNCDGTFSKVGTYTAGMYSNGDKPTHCPLVISRNAAFPRGINGTARPLRRSGAAAAPSEAAASGSRSATKTPNAVWAEVLRHPTNISEDELLSYTHTRALLQLPYARPVPWGSVQSPPFTIKSKNSLYALMVTMVGVRKKEPCKHCSQSRCRFKGCYVLPRQSDPHSVLSGLSACSNCIYKYNAISTCVGRSADSKSANSSRFSSASKEASANRSHLSAAVGKTALKRPRPWSEESEREGSSPMPKRHKTNGLSLGSSESPTGSAVRLNAHRQARAAAEAKGYRLKAPAPGRRPSIASLARKTSATACQTAARSPVSASAATSSAASSSSPKAAPQPPPLPALPPATPTNESLATALAATTISARASTAAADWELAPGHVYESRDGDQGDGGRDVALSWPYLRACGASSASGLAVRPGLRELVVLVLPGTVHEFPVEPLPLIDEDDDGSRGGRGVVRRVSVALSAVKVWLAPADRRGGGRSSREEDDDIDLATAETSNEKEEEDSVGRGKEKQALPSLSVQSPFFLGAGGVVYIDPGVRCRVECRQYEPALLNVLIIDQGL